MFCATITLLFDIFRKVVEGFLSEGMVWRMGRGWGGGAVEIAWPLYYSEEGILQGFVVI